MNLGRSHEVDLGVYDASLRCRIPSSTGYRHNCPVLRIKPGRLLGIFGGNKQDLRVCENKQIVILNETKEGQILKPQFQLNVPCVLITTKEANELCIQCADTPFYERYPDSPGYIKLSGISFNSLLNRASPLVERYCGLLCAEGIYVTLIKQDGIWAVQSKNVSWES